MEQLKSDAPVKHKPHPPHAVSGRLALLIGLMGVTLLLLVADIFLKKADASKPSDWNEDRFTYLPSGKYLRPMSLGYEESMADIFWIQAIIYFSDAYMQHKSYRWLSHLLDIITILNPHFSPAYDMAGVVLTKEKTEIPKTLGLLNRGIGEFPDNWRLRLFAALAQLTLDSNFTRAAEYLQPIALNRDVPDHIRTMSATLLNKGGGRRVALTFLVHSYIHSNNAINREIFVSKILKLYPLPEGQPDGRRDTVVRVLKELAVAPEPGIYMGLGVLHEYLTDKVSDNSRRLLQLLTSP